jgi:hypothetical protein
MELFLSSAAILLSVILLSFNARRFRTAIYLGTYFLLLGFYCLGQFLFNDGNAVIKRFRSARHHHLAG